MREEIRIYLTCLFNIDSLYKCLQISFTGCRVVNMTFRCMLSPCSTLNNLLYFLFFVIAVYVMSSQKLPPSSSRNPNPSSSLKPKPQPPEDYVRMRNDRFQENKQILRDGLTPAERVRSKQQFGTKQKLNEINPTNKP